MICNPKTTEFCFLGLILGAIASSAFAVSIQYPSTIVATRGAVSVDNTSSSAKTLPASVKPNSIVKTSVGGGALLIPVPGQVIYLAQNSELLLQSAQVDPKNVTVARSSSVILQRGRLSAAIWKPKQGQSDLMVTTPRCKMQAHGTGWAADSSDSGDTIVVYAGTVSVTVNGYQVDIQPGQVAFLTGSAGSISMLIVDLKTGTAIRYGNSSIGTVELPTPNDLKLARDFLEANLPAFIGTASERDRLAFAQILDALNSTLSKNLLTPISTPEEWLLFPGWDPDKWSIPLNEAV